MKQVDRDIVVSNPAFLNAKCESILSEAINNKMQELIRGVMHTDEVIRVKLLKRTYDKLCELIDANEKESTNLWSSKLVYSHTFDEAEDGKYLKELFCSLTVRILSSNTFKIENSNSTFSAVKVPSPSNEPFNVLTSIVFKF